MPSDPSTGIAVEIPYGVLEYSILFERPIIRTWVPGPLVEAVLETIGGMGFSVEGVEVTTGTDKISDQTIVFRRTSPSVPNLSLTVTLSKIVVVAENLDWS